MPKKKKLKINSLIDNPIFKNEYKLLVGIDASTHNVGVAFYDPYSVVFPFETSLLTFKGNYSIDRLIQIYDKLKILFLDFKRYENVLIIIEEPLLPIGASRSISQLNQVAGSIVSLCRELGFDVMYIHNRTAKSLMKIKSKEDSINAAIKIARNLKSKNISEHEADAVMLIASFIKLQERVYAGKS